MGAGTGAGRRTSGAVGRRTASTAVGALLATLLLAGCSEAEPDGLTPVTLQLSGTTRAQFAGYVLADEQGYYAAAGLDVTLREAGDSTVPVEVLARGGADYAISGVAPALGSIGQGAEVTNVAQVFERSGTVQVSPMGQGIDAPADLAGKQIGVRGDGDEWELYAGLRSAGVDVAQDVELVRQGRDMGAFVSGDVDAAQATTYAEMVQLLQTVNPQTGEQYQPDDLETISWDRTGSALLSDAVWADTARLADDPAYRATTVAFLTASLRGWIYARDHPQDATAGVVGAGGPTLGVSHQLRQVNEVNRLIWPSGRGIGSIDPREWERTVATALAARNPAGETLLDEPPPEGSFTNAYVRLARERLADQGEDTTGESWQPLRLEAAEVGGGDGRRVTARHPPGRGTRPTSMRP